MMLRGLRQTIRYARSWSSGAKVTSQDVEIEREGRSVPATFVLPARRNGRLPGWVALGGITRMGRFHPQLVRFSQALASSGAAVLVPEVREWSDLHLAPEMAAPTVRASIQALWKRSEVRPGPVGLIGFSFGAPHAAIATTMDGLADDIGGIVLFGGYCDLERTLRCELTGFHEWQGVEHELDPDPYGGWIVASNHLTDVPGYEDAADVAAALRHLAHTSSGGRMPAWLPAHDPLKAELRRSIAEKRRKVFDIFAWPTTAGLPERAASDEMATVLSDACRRVEPLLDATKYLDQVRLPTRLIHGRGDRLIPFTESLRFKESIPNAVKSHVLVTGLFAHSADKVPPSLPERVREGVTFFKALHGLLGTV